MEVALNEQRNDRLMRTYKIYNVVDWIIAIIIIVTPLLLITIPFMPYIQQGGLDEVVFLVSIEAFMGADC
jgi:hypothetical protein